MSKLLSILNVYSGTYNFASDGGAVGLINLGVIIPANNQYCYFSVTEKSNLTGGAVCSISFGYLQVGSGAPASDTSVFFAITQVTAFSLNVPVYSSNILATPIRLTFPVVITMSIINTDITAGSLQFDLFTILNG